MTISGSKKRSGDSAGIRESKVVLGSSKDGAGVPKNQPLHIPAPLNPSEMMSQYKNASLEFGSVTKSSVAIGRLSHQDEGDVNHGAYRLAHELNQFISKGLDAALAEDKNYHHLPKSGESVADLQLQTARKLRQVRNVCCADLLLRLCAKALGNRTLRVL